MSEFLTAGWYIEAVMRLTLIAVACYNIRFSWKPTIDFAHGKNMAPTIFYASIFFGNIAYLIFGLLFFFGFASYAWTLLLLTLRLISGTLISIAYRGSIDRRVDEFYDVYNALPQALAISDLMKVDPENGEKLAREATRLYAIKVAGSQIHAI